MVLKQGLKVQYNTFLHIYACVQMYISTLEAAVRWY
jgi:hypothetical protein